MSTVTDTVRHGVDTEKLTIRVAAKTSYLPSACSTPGAISPNGAPTCGRT
jgi:hypothetical protein